MFGVCGGVEGCCIVRCMWGGVPFFFFFFETGFLCATLIVLELNLYVDQAGLELRDPPASAS